MQGQTIGGFQVIRELGRGGMGIVYEAEQSSPRRHVALKVLPAEFAHSPGVAARFEQEANRMAMLDGHPNIATVYAAGEDNGTAYFAMQLLTGGDLEQRLARQGRFDQREAAQIIAKVADALDHAHHQGIVHRDVKPANIMFSARGEPVVTDFGIAQAADQVRMTMTGMSVCTPEYASPEQVKGNPVDGRSDLYSLGVVLYRMVTGRPLFDCANPMTWAMKHISEVPQPPGVWCSDLNPQLQTIILKCLQKEPSDRFANGHDVAQALRTIDWNAVAAPARTTVTQKPEPRRPDRPPPVWPYVVGGMGFIALLVGVALVVGPCKPKVVEVPSVVGSTPNEARRLLEQIDLTMQQTGTGARITSQSPGAGSAVRRGSVVQVTVGEQPPTFVVVPNVCGMTLETARAALMDAGGLPMQSGEQRYDNTWDAGEICSQFPKPGTQVERGDAVRVVVSKGPIDDRPVRAAYANWLKAWQSRNINAYMACYARDCIKRPHGKPPQDYDTIRIKMTELFAEVSFITIKSSNLRITMAGDTATVSAWQEYNSSIWHDSGTKRLVFVLRDDRWLILRESFTMSSGGKGPR